MCNYSGGFIKLSPRLTLAFLTTINIIIYLDRGAIAGVLGKISDDLNLNTIEAGLLGSIFMLGYMIASPIMAHMAQFVHPLNLMLLGLIIWSGAVIGCGITDNYALLCIFRSFTGVGEASFVSLAPPHIIKIAPSQTVSLWLAIFSSALFLGTAGGYIYSSSVTSAAGNVNGSLESWHWPFLLVACFMFPFIILLILLYKDPEMFVRRRTEENSEGETLKFSEQLTILLKNPVYIFLSLGYAGYAFTTGGLAYWGPVVVEELFDMSSENSSFILGSITIACGFTATLFGSWVLDKKLKICNMQFENKVISEVTYEYCRTQIAVKLLFIFTIIGSIIATLAASFKIFPVFIVGISLSEFFIFAGTAPIGVALMTSVPPELRGQANAVAIFILHLLGDFPSPLIVGVFIYFWGYFIGFLICMAWFFFAALSWGIAWNFSVRFMQRFYGDSFKNMLKNFCKRKKLLPGDETMKFLLK